MTEKERIKKINALKKADIISLSDGDIVEIKTKDYSYYEFTKIGDDSITMICKSDSLPIFSSGVPVEVISSNFKDYVKMFHIIEKSSLCFAYKDVLYQTDKITFLNIIKK